MTDLISHPLYSKNYAHPVLETWLPISLFLSVVCCWIPFLLIFPMYYWFLVASTAALTVGLAASYFGVNFTIKIAHWFLKHPDQAFIINAIAEILALFLLVGLLIALSNPVSLPVVLTFLLASSWIQATVMTLLTMFVIVIHSSKLTAENIKSQEQQSYINEQSNHNPYATPYKQTGPRFINTPIVITKIDRKIKPSNIKPAQYMQDLLQALLNNLFKEKNDSNLLMLAKELQSYLFFYKKDPRGFITPVTTRIALHYPHKPPINAQASIAAEPITAHLVEMQNLFFQEIEARQIVFKLLEILTKINTDACPSTDNSAELIKQAQKMVVNTPITAICQFEGNIKTFLHQTSVKDNIAQPRMLNLAEYLKQHQLTNINITNGTLAMTISELASHVQQCILTRNSSLPKIDDIDSKALEVKALQTQAIAISAQPISPAKLLQTLKNSTEITAAKNTLNELLKTLVDEKNSSREDYKLAELESNLTTTLNTLAEYSKPISLNYLNKGGILTMSVAQHRRQIKALLANISLQKIVNQIQTPSSVKALQELNDLYEKQDAYEHTLKTAAQEIAMLKIEQSINNINIEVYKKILKPYFDEVAAVSQTLQFQEVLEYLPPHLIPKSPMTTLVYQGTYIDLEIHNHIAWIQDVLNGIPVRFAIEDARCKQEWENSKNYDPNINPEDTVAEILPGYPL